LFKSFLDFQRSHNQESFCWKQKSSYATAVRKSLTGCNLKETRKVDLPKFQALIKLSSVIEAENLHQVYSSFKFTSWPVLNLYNSIHSINLHVENGRNETV
jgi:hypothetical protein